MLKLVRWRKVAIISLLSFVFFVGHLYVAATMSLASDHKLNELDALAERLYKEVQGGQLEQARTSIIEISEKVTNIDFDGRISAEGLEALMETVVEGKHTLTSIQFAEQEGMIATAKIRLAIDALTHPNHPMWLQSYNVLRNEGLKLGQAFKNKQTAEIEHAKARIMSQYTLIRPAMLISRSAIDVNMMDSYLAFLQEQTDQAALEQFEPLLNQLFQKESSSTYVEVPTQSRHTLLWIATIGTIIVSVLSYVAWKKYQLN